MQEIRFRLHIPAEDFLAHYRGEAHQVVVTADDGRVLRFPSGILRSFVTRDGISGHFQLRYDDQGRFHSIERL